MKSSAYIFTLTSQSPQNLQVDLDPVRPLEIMNISGLASQHLTPQGFSSLPSGRVAGAFSEGAQAVEGLV